MEKNNYNIYCLKKNNTLQEVASITHLHTKNDFDCINDQIDINLNPIPTNIVFLTNYFAELYKLMINLDKKSYFNEIVKTTLYTFPGNEYIQATIFERVYMRKGTYYYVMQQSDRGVRFLLYAINRVHHSSDAFGTMMRNPVCIEELKNMQLKLITLGEKEKLVVNSKYVLNKDLYFL
jgi:hypothetical protein